MQGVPHDGAFETVDELVKTITSTIYNGSAQHAVHFYQYDDYAFPANYPAMLHGKIPTSKVCQSNFSILLSMRLLSTNTITNWKIKDSFWYLIRREKCSIGTIFYSIEPAIMEQPANQIAIHT